MKYRLFSQSGLLAVLISICFLPVRLTAQSGEFTVRIKQPVFDTVRICPGKSLPLIAEGLNADASTFDPSKVNFTWDVGYNGQTVSQPSTSFTYPVGGHYVIRLYVTGRTGGPAALNIPEIHVFVSLRPSFEGTRADQTSICSGNEIGLTGFVTPVPWTKDSFQFENSFEQSEYIWDGIGIQSDRNGIARIKPPLDKGDMHYIFRVKDNFGCYHDTTLVLYGVFARFTAKPKSGEAPLLVEMVIDSSSNGADKNLIRYDWEFFENSDTTNLLTSSAMNITLERPGEYTARVRANYQQCQYRYTAENFIRVDSSLLEIPNVFTPNEDGVNDYFQVKALSLKSFSGRIFNRWGRVVYEWTDPKTLERGWNGRYMNDGTAAPSGTYYYIISATGYDDKVYEGKKNEKMYYGFVTLIR